jgi:hypothetical protein
MAERSQQAAALVGMPVAAESTIQAHWCSETALYPAIPLVAETALVETPLVQRVEMEAQVVPVEIAMAALKSALLLEFLAAQGWA